MIGRSHMNTYQGGGTTQGKIILIKRQFNVWNFLFSWAARATFEYFPLKTFAFTMNDTI